MTTTAITGPCASSPDGAHDWRISIFKPCAQCGAMPGSYVNLTPHPVIIHGTDRDGEPAVTTIPASGRVARVEQEMLAGEFGPWHDELPADAAEVDWCRFPVAEVRYGGVSGLPAHRVLHMLGHDTSDVDTVEHGYIVSMVVATHPDVTGRPDVYFPGEAVRNAAGTVTGCRGLYRATSQ